MLSSIIRLRWSRTKMDNKPFFGFFELFRWDSEFIAFNKEIHKYMLSF
jgi:hypothetical protein